MRRAVAVTVFLVALLTASGWAQHRGMSAGFAGRGGFGFHGGFAGRGPVFFNGHRGINLRIVPRRQFFFHERFHRFYPGAAFYGYPSAYYPSDFGDYSYAAAPDYQYQYAQNQAIEQQQLSQEISRLSDEVERLREQQESSNAAPREPARRSQTYSRAEPSTPTELVFKDQHQEDVENYAVVGKILWIFNEQQARKVPLADLDLSATQKVNEDRGVEFQPPRSSQER
jgi:hypothetical protein